MSKSTKELLWIFFMVFDFWVYISKLHKPTITELGKTLFYVSIFSKCIKKYSFYLFFKKLIVFLITY
jgi:hypothetical protein